MPFGKSVDEFNDINTIDQYYIARKAGLNDTDAISACSKMSRDNARTPMQWDSSKNAGFTNGTPWLKVNSNYKLINVENQEKNPDSVLNYYKKLLSVRKSDEYIETFTYGEFIPAYENTETVMAYYRVFNNKRILVIANFGKDTATVPVEYSFKHIILSNKGRSSLPTTSISLESCEVLVLECDN